MYSEILILAMLRQGPRHGYEIKKEVEEVLAGTVSLNNKTLYPMLKHFEEMGAVERRVVTQEGKPNRHVFSLTERGMELLHDLLCDFPASLAGVEAEFFTRVSFFDYLTQEEQKAILKQRLAHLEGGLNYLERMQQMTEGQECAPTMGISMSNAKLVLAFHTQRIREEYQWVASLLEKLQASS